MTLEIRRLCKPRLICWLDLKGISLEIETFWQIASKVPMEKNSLWYFVNKK